MRCVKLLRPYPALISILAATVLSGVDTGTAAVDAPASHFHAFHVAHALIRRVLWV